MIPRPRATSRSQLYNDTNGEIVLFDDIDSVERVALGDTVWSLSPIRLMMPVLTDKRKAIEVT